jgi:membrane protease YdiL (CAAX protease family)
MGYAFDPMENRWKTIRAALILAIVWALWHIPGFYLAGASVMYVVVFSINFLAWRLLIVWIYKNTGKTLFAVSLFHATGNITLSGLPLPGVSIGGGLSGVIAIAVASAVAALAVILLWDPELNRFRFGKVEEVN